jgi:hypothetical protein
VRMRRLVPVIFLALLLGCSVPPPRQWTEDCTVRSIWQQCAGEACWFDVTIERDSAPGELKFYKLHTATQVWVGLHCRIHLKDWQDDFFGNDPAWATVEYAERLDK